MSSGSTPDGSEAERYRALLGQTHDVITVVDHEGTVHWQSPSSEPVKGHPPEDLVGENILEYIHPEDRDRVAERMATVVDEPGRLDERMEMRFRTASGEWIWLSSTAVNPGPDSPIDGFVINSRDVTERRRAERQREREAERLERFASIVSHDLRNPLNVAQAGVEVLRAETEDEHVETVADALDRMETLIEDTLTLAREGRTIGEMQPVALGRVVEQCWRGVPTDAATLEVVDDAVIEADPDRLMTVLENLIGNAVKHASSGPPAGGSEDDDGSGGGGVAVRVGIVEDDAFGFYVEDDGPGIPAAERERVFETGHTTAEDGTGFGLAIVEDIVEAHGWRVRITESASDGARFEITGVERADAPAGGTPGD